MMVLKKSYKQVNNVLFPEVLYLAENETKVLKTGGKNLVKNTRTSHSLPSYLIISSIYLCSPSSPLQIIAKLSKVHKKNLLTLTLVHANSTALQFVCLTILATNPYFKLLLNQLSQ